MSTEEREKLDAVSAAARKAQDAGKYQVAIGCLDVEGEAWFRVFGNDHRWKSVRVNV